MVPCRRSREKSTGACEATKMPSSTWVVEAYSRVADRQLVEPGEDHDADRR